MKNLPLIAFCLLGITRIGVAEETPATPSKLPTPHHDENTSIRQLKDEFLTYDSIANNVIDEDKAREARVIEVNIAFEIAAAFQQRITRTGFVQAQLAFIVGDYYRAQKSAKSAVQITQAANEAAFETNLLLVAQNQKLIDQNNQIIALLTKIAEKK